MTIKSPLTKSVGGFFYKILQPFIKAKNTLTDIVKLDKYESLGLIVITLCEILFKSFSCPITNSNMYSYKIWPMNR